MYLSVIFIRKSLYSLPKDNSYFTIFLTSSGICFFVPSVLAYFRYIYNANIQQFYVLLKVSKKNFPSQPLKVMIPYFIPSLAWNVLIQLCCNTSLIFHLKFSISDASL